VIDAAVVDIRLEEGDVTNTEGMTFLDELDKYYAEDRIHAVMLSGHGTIALATAALARPSRNVLTYFEKEKLYAESDRFIAEIAHAVRVAQTKRDEKAVHRVLPAFFVEAINIPSLTASLVPEVETLAAKKDLGILLRSLLLSALPLAMGAKVEIDQCLAGTKAPVVYILCWSRRLAKALEVSIGRRGMLEKLMPRDHWQEIGPAEKMSNWSTQHFDGIIYELSGVSFEKFLSVVPPIS
jgi:hypothetical protein